MKEIERLTKFYKKEPISFPVLGKEILEAFFKTEREFLETLQKQEISSILLKIANFPQYKKDAPEITDLRKAILVLGEDFVKLILLCIIAKKLTKPTFNEFDFSKFWARALTNACFSHILSSELGNESNYLFVSSFLMDFGIIVLYHFFPEGYLKVLRLKQAGKSLLEAEREVFQTDHAVIGGEYFERLILPRRLVLTIYNHHNPITQLQDQVPEEALQDIKKLQVIDKAVGAYFSIEREIKYREYLELSQNQLNISKDTAEYLLEILPDHINPLFEIFEWKKFLLIPYSKWLKEEQKKLIEKIESIKQKEKKEKDLLEKQKLNIIKLLRERELLLQEIQILKNKLSSATILDELTGVYNQKFLLKRLKEEILRAKRYKRVFSFLLLEIEKFNEIIEKLGLDKEGIILKELAEKIVMSLRRVDIVGKLDVQPQFAIILPETPSQGAWVVARRLLKLIESYFWEKFRIKKSGFIVILTFDPKEMDPKKDTSPHSVLIFAQKALEYLKEKLNRNIIAVKCDKELE